MITPCLSNELSKKWGPPLATPVRKICAAGDNGASQQSAAKCAVTLTSAGTAPALCAMLADIIISSLLVRLRLSPTNGALVATTKKKIARDQSVGLQPLSLSISAAR